MPAAGRSAGAPSSTAPLALRELTDALTRAGAREAAIERPDGPVIDALLDAGIIVVAISPNQVKNLHGRYGSAGNKDDRFNAFVLADTLRTDRARLRPLTPDSPATTALRRVCRARKDLVGHRVAVANQLRAHLHNVFPGAAGLFAQIDSPVSLAFLARFATQDRAGRPDRPGPDRAVQARPGESRKRRSQGGPGKCDQTEKVTPWPLTVAVSLSSQWRSSARHSGNARHG